MVVDQDTPGRIMLTRNDSLPHAVQRDRAYSFFVAPGPYELTVIDVLGRTRESLTLPCEVAQSRYVHVRKIGFWWPRPGAVELAPAEALPMIADVISEAPRDQEAAP